MKPAIAYIRVSTGRQGKSGLDLEAQQAAIERFATQEGFAAPYRPGSRVFEDFNLAARRGGDHAPTAAVPGPLPRLARRLETGRRLLVDLATQRGLLIDQRHLRSGLGRRERGRHSSRAATDHQDLALGSLR